MKKSDINQPACYFDRYIDQIDEIELSQAFRESLTDLKDLDFGRLNQIGENVYADGKWSIKTIFQHLIDAEHILSYRSLRIGRNDPTELPGFDEALFAANVDTSARSLESLVEELQLLRQATERLFESFGEDALNRSGVVNGNRMSVLAYGFAILGHQKHHISIIQERYFPLITNRLTSAQR